MIRLLFLPTLLLLTILPAGAIQIALTRPTATSLQTELTIYQPPGSLPEMVAQESMGAVLTNRIELRYPSSLLFAIGALEPGWLVQTDVVTEGLNQVGLATFFFCGFDPQSDLEYYSFYNRWTSSFTFTDSSGQAPSSEVPLQIEIFASAILVGSGQIPVSAEGTFLEDTSHVVPEQGNTLPLTLLALVATAAARFGTKLPDRRHAPSATSHG